MASNPVLIRNIRHLADARYFAAMEVDWISITLDESDQSFARWHSLRDWISGINMAAEVFTDDEALIAKTIIDASPEGIVLNNLDFIHLTGGLQMFIPTEEIGLYKGHEFINRIIPYEKDTLVEIMHTRNAEMIYLEAKWTPELLTGVFDAGYQGGVCFDRRGIRDDGMYDYSKMDDMLAMVKT